MSIIQGVKNFRKVFDNWFSVLLNMVVLKRDCTCKFKNIGEVKLKGGRNYLNNPMFMAVFNLSLKDFNNPQYIKTLKNYITQQIDNDIIKIKIGKDSFNFLNIKEINTVFETFFNGEYEDIPSVKNKSMIDIGASIGDTAIYFANKGYNVYAFEAVPYIYEIANKNLSLNPQFKDKITLINKAVSCKKGTITISSDPNSSTCSSEYSKANENSNTAKDFEVETISINDVIEEYNIEPYALKMDCEGCEVNIIENSDLSMFTEIIMEYHTCFTGIHEDKLMDILEKQGFQLKNKIEHHDELGIIYMTQKKG